MTAQNIPDKAKRRAPRNILEHAGGLNSEQYVWASKKVMREAWEPPEALGSTCKRMVRSPEEASKGFSARMLREITDLRALHYVPESRWRTPGAAH